jgi:hypothetical protein
MQRCVTSWEDMSMADLKQQMTGLDAHTHLKSHRQLYCSLSQAKLARLDQQHDLGAHHRQAIPLQKPTSQTPSLQPQIPI